MSRALGDAYAYMTSDMRGKLGHYMTSLEHRYGDPAVYAAQREEMAAEQAAVLYAEAKSRETVLASTYNSNREKIREKHKLRMVQFAQDKPPRYMEADTAP